MTSRIIVLSLLLTVFIASPTCAASEKVNKAMLGGARPLVVSEKTLTCDRGKALHSQQIGKPTP
jgi:hypothetical protein